MQTGCYFLLLFRLEKAKGVGTLPILPYLKVQVVAGGISGGTHIADHFALLHFLPNGYADRGTMGIFFLGILLFRLRLNFLFSADQTG